MEDEEYRISRMVSTSYLLVLFRLFVGVNQSTFWALAANRYVKHVFVGYFGRYGPPEFRSNFHRMNHGIKDVTSNQPGKIHGKSGKEAQKKTGKAQINGINTGLMMEFLLVLEPYSVGGQQKVGAVAPPF